MKRTALIALLVALAAVGAALLYTTLAREAQFRRLMADGEAALASDQTFVAAENFSGAIALKPDSMLAYLRRGEAYRRRGGPDDLQKALRDLRTAAQIDPSAPKPQEALGDVNLALERFGRAAESYQACLKLDDQSSTVRYKLAFARFRLGDAAAAIPALRQAVGLNDRFAEAYYLLGVCQAQIGQDAEAVTSLQRAIETAPAVEATPPVYRRGNDAESRQETARYRRLIETESRQELVRLLVGLKRESEAIGELDKLAAADPSKPEPLVEAAVLYARLGRPDMAVAQLNLAIARDPSQPRAYQVLGRLWLQAYEERQDRVWLNKALQALDSALRAPDVSSEAFTLYGRALALSGDLPGAADAFGQALRKAPVDPLAYRELAGLAQRRGDTQLARDSLVRYLALSNDAREARELAERIGELSLHLDQRAEAARWFRQAADASDDDPATMSRLASLQLRAADPAGAAATVERGLQKSPTNPTLLALKRRAQ